MPSTPPKFGQNKARCAPRFAFPSPRDAPAAHLAPDEEGRRRDHRCLLRPRRKWLCAASPEKRRRRACGSRGGEPGAPRPLPAQASPPKPPAEGARACPLWPTASPRGRSRSRDASAAPRPRAGRCFPPSPGHARGGRRRFPGVAVKSEPGSSRMAACLSRKCITHGARDQEPVNGGADSRRFLSPSPRVDIRAAHLFPCSH